MMGDSTKRSFKELLGLAKLPERTVQVCLRGDLRAEFEDLERQLEQAQERRTDSLEDPGTGELQFRIEALREEMRESTATIRLRAMPRPKWRQFIAAHPPRRDPETNEIVEDDRRMDVNVETLYDDLVRESIVEPELDDATYREFEAALTDYQFSELAGAAWALNRAEVDVPFSRVVSRTNRSSGDG